MKKAALSLSLLSLTAFASSAGYIKDFNYQLTDLADKKLNKELLFQGMERRIMDLKNSICANRAHLWAYDFHRFYGINSGKIFIFFSSSIWKDDKKGWMYHVAPYIVENGKEYVMEASYPDVLQPLTIEEWVENENPKLKGNECVEIAAADKDLTEYFYDRYNLPEQRSNGKPGARCYIRKVPGHYWYPTSIAFHDIKKNADGKPVEYNPQGYDFDDVMDACVETASSKITRIFGGGKDKCKKHFRRYTPRYN